MFESSSIDLNKKSFTTRVFEMTYERPKKETIQLLLVSAIPVQVLTHIVIDFIYMSETKDFNLIKHYPQIGRLAWKCEWAFQNFVIQLDNIYFRVKYGGDFQFKMNAATLKNLNTILDKFDEHMLRMQCRWQKPGLVMDPGVCPTYHAKVQDGDLDIYPKFKTGGLGHPNYYEGGCFLEIVGTKDTGYVKYNLRAIEIIRAEPKFNQRWAKAI